MLAARSTCTAPITTLAVRKAAEASRRKRAAEAALDEMRAYARQNGGRFIVFGSCVSGEVRFDSDLDVLVDFPSERATAAWSFVEDLCCLLAIPPNLHDARTTAAAFVDRVIGRGRVLA